eukprot:1159164-Pelagomonas_calceolata.AAC.7
MSHKHLSQLPRDACMALGSPGACSDPSHPLFENSNKSGFPLLTRLPHVAPMHALRQIAHQQVTCVSHAASHRSCARSCAIKSRVSLAPHHTDHAPDHAPSSHL